MTIALVDYYHGVRSIDDHTLYHSDDHRSYHTVYLMGITRGGRGGTPPHVYMAPKPETFGGRLARRRDGLRAGGKTVNHSGVDGFWAMFSGGKLNASMPQLVANLGQFMKHSLCVDDLASHR